MDIGLSDNELLQEIAKNQRSINERMKWIMMTCFAIFIVVCYVGGQLIK